TTGQPGPQSAPAADRACQQQRQTLSHCERPDAPVEGRRPRSRDGALLRPAQFPGTPEPLVTDDLIGINLIVNNRHVIPNDGERYRNGEPIATGFVESTVNEVVSKRFCKKQHMQWSKEGAHLLLQTRVRTLNGELSAIFKRWYPDMDLEVEA